MAVTDKLPCSNAATSVRRSRRIAAAAGTGILVAALTSSGSGAAAPPRTVGELFVPTGSCFGVTELQTKSPGNQHRVPGTGVITSMRTVIGADGSPTTVTFKVARAGTTADTWRAVGTSRAIPVTVNSVVQRNLRIPTRAGDVLGIYAPAHDCYRVATSEHQITQGAGELSGAETAMSPINGYQLPIEGTWEPDADGDRYGDRTQDSCATDPTTQRGCATSRPRTLIRAISVARNGTVRVAFGANERATFRCAVDSPAYRSCRSPFVRRLAPGRHTIAVVATDRFGNTDASPAIARVSVPRR